ncbi:MAG: hypothetical protein R3F11_12945 [Verrucomicrobiales bacterium]
MPKQPAAPFAAGSRRRSFAPLTDRADVPTDHFSGTSLLPSRARFRQGSAAIGIDDGDQPDAPPRSHPPRTMKLIHFSKTPDNLQPG